MCIASPNDNHIGPLIDASTNSGFENADFDRLWLAREVSTLAHVTFVHGIGNKPEKDALLDQWRTALAVDDGLDLDDLGVTSSMVYWADLLYDRPLASEAANESNALDLERAVDPEDADLTWLDDVPPDERQLVEGLARSVGFVDISATPELGPAPVPPDLIRPDSPLEAIPLPGFLKRRLMRVLLRDVHHFLFDAEFSPRPGETFHIRQDIRARALDALRSGARHTGPHVLVGHSLGSVIAYDALTGVDGAPAVDALITIGSPLGISEVQEGLTPPWTRDDGWPSARLRSGGWANFYDPLDPVCGGPDRLLAPDYRRGGAAHVADVHVTNKGSWRHSIDKYLGQGALRDWMRRATTD